MSPIEKLPGLYLASGFSGHGFGVGPSAGHLIADIVSGDKPIVDPTPINIVAYLKARPMMVCAARCSGRICSCLRLYRSLAFHPIVFIMSSSGLRTNF